MQIRDLMKGESQVNECLDCAENLSSEMDEIVVVAAKNDRFQVWLESHYWGKPENIVACFYGGEAAY
jgi:hypothetical protein